MGRFLLAISLVLAGCASYTTPGAGVSLAGISEGAIEEAFRREPAASFPARVAVARVQASGYVSASNAGYGQGAFSVVTVRDVATDADFAALESLDNVQAVAPLTRLLLPATLTTTRDLRVAAAQLKTDLLVLYTIDTSFRTDVQQLGPLQTIALGFLRTHNAQVSATASALVLDVRSGYLWGTAEATATEEQRSDLWGSHNAVESARSKAERASFGEMLTVVSGLLAELKPAS